MDFASRALDRNHTLKELLSDIGPVRVLTREEEVALGSVIQSPELPRKFREDAIQVLMRHNIRLLIRIARKYRLDGEDIGEVVGRGTFGLRRAAELFDPKSGHKFSTYAVGWIRQKIGRCRLHEANGRPWRMPDYLFSHRSRCETLRRQLAAKGEEITVEEAARRLGLSASYAHFWALDSIAVQESLGRTAGEADDYDYRLEDFQGRDDPEADERREQQAAIEKMLPKLPPRERRVIRYYYGFDEVPGIRRATGRVAAEPGGLIAKHLGISRERVRQIRQSALNRLRRMAQEVGCS